MENLRDNTRVVVITGYMDCQCQYQGYEGRVVGRSSGRYLVRNSKGEVEVLEPAMIMPLAKQE